VGQVCLINITTSSVHYDLHHLKVSCALNIRHTINNVQHECGVTNESLSQTFIESDRESQSNA